MSIKTPGELATEHYDKHVDRANAGEMVFWRETIRAAIEADRAQRTSPALAWRDGYFTGKRDYAGSIMGGASISTPNPYEGVN